MTEGEKLASVARGALVVIVVMSLVCLAAGTVLGSVIAGTAECPAPEYDVARVVKMHEESRLCETTLEECKDTVKICAGLLKQALE